VMGQKGWAGNYLYANYAYGGESEEEWYGKDNLERLKALKGRWDPENRSKFYAPIGLGNFETKDEEHSEP
jgi:hypothetical protein